MITTSATFAEPPPAVATIVSTAPGFSVACESSISLTKEHRMSAEEKDAPLALQEAKKREEIIRYLILKFYKHTFFIQSFYSLNNIETHYHHMWDKACAAHGYTIPLGSCKPNVSDHLNNFVVFE